MGKSPTFSCSNFSSHIHKAMKSAMLRVVNVDFKIFVAL